MSSARVENPANRIEYDNQDTVDFISKVPRPFVEGELLLYSASRGLESELLRGEKSLICSKYPFTILLQYRKVYDRNISHVPNTYICRLTYLHCINGSK